MTSLIHRLEKFIEYLMAAALAVMFVAVFANVVLRYVFGSGIAASEELSRLLFVWLIFLGATLAMGRHTHLGFDLVQRALPAPLRKLCAIVSHGLMLYSLWLCLEGSWHQFEIGLRITSTVMKYPLALMAASGLVLALGMGLYLLANLIRILIGHPDAHIPGQHRHDLTAAEEMH
ncbi:C4-dicarboxylate ABC transporter permease [Pokkaliibacter plantistimulans]|uniref:TRAP transporter small permease protein n=1 Tax=Pokkaliibacter plantistimulans TaxID=1635171 RepID=A0ABX5LZX6_9GAMM|nr:TRAP transporter small permease [Pokkaliibacter plantistimulans]PXF31861.1 C4-dicarboxylate ABC transporter permease [Pokkaliibacter plantistimulans]